MGKPYNLGVLVGRFQMLHKGHEEIIEKSLELCEKTAVFIGSSQESRTEKNPFSFEERKEMLKTVFGDKIMVFPLPDIGVGNNSAWGEYVIKNVVGILGKKPDLLVSGEEERRNTWYDGQNIKQIFIEKTVDISASKLREYIINGDSESFKKYTNEKLWDKYPFIRNTILSSKDNTDTKSI